MKHFPFISSFIQSIIQFDSFIKQSLPYRTEQVKMLSDQNRTEQNITLFTPTPFCYGRKEGNVLFNDALNTFYLRLYVIRHMVKDHSDGERGNPLPPHGLLFPISSKGSFYMHHPTDRISHTSAFVTPVVEHWLEWEIAQWVHPMKDRSDDTLHH